MAVGRFEKAAGYGIIERKRQPSWRERGIAAGEREQTKGKVCSYRN